MRLFNRYLNSLKPQERRTYRLQEIAFWKIHRPASRFTNRFYEVEMDSGPEVNRQTENEFEVHPIVS